MVEEYDLIIIGSGSGNTLITPEWASKKVCILEAGTFGGTCLNAGCIPTKQYVYPATLAYQASHLDKLGLKAQVTQVDWPAIRDRIFTRIDAISAQGAEYRRQSKNVSLIPEKAHFVASHRLETSSGRILTAPNIVIAAGSSNKLPDIPGINLPQVHSSDTIMRIEEQPKEILIIGGGFVAAEFSHIFNGLGSQVTQVNRSQTLLRSYDQEVVARYTEQISQRWQLKLDHTVTALEPAAKNRIKAHLSHGGQRVSLEADLVLFASGRQANTAGLRAADFFDLGPEQNLQVDAYQRVLAQGKPVPGIFALGDVCSETMLKHLANAQARIVAHNLTHPDQLQARDQRFVPSAVFSHPQLAMVGLTQEQAEQRARAEGFDITVKVQEYADVAYGWAMEDQGGMCKLIARKDTGQLLGAHLVGEQASVLIQPLIQAMSFEQPVQNLARGQYWIHPALTEVVENALLGLELD